MQSVMAKGFLVGLAYLVPIGMQNLYVIQAGLTQSKKRMYFVVFTTVFFDILLGLAGFFGMGLLFKQNETIKIILLLGGGAFVVLMGISIIKSKPSFELQNTTYDGRLKVILACFLVTWANPQAVLDSTLLFGSSRAGLTGELVNYFIIGTSLASLGWFFSIGTLSHLLKSIFQQKVLRAINMICGIVLVYYGIHLIHQATTSLSLPW